MHGSGPDRRALEREALRNVIAQWNANRLDLFELSEPNEDLEFHGVMRFYFQDSGQKVATKCIRVASDATVEDVIGTLVEKFRPDMRMLSVPAYALYELHENGMERQLQPDEKPLLVQLNWHVDDREGRFLLKNTDERTVETLAEGALQGPHVSFRRKLSKREKKQLKKQEKLQRMKSENGTVGANKDGVAEKLYSELPETSFTRSISNPEAVMRRRRRQKLEQKLQQFRSKDGGPDTGGTLKIYGEALCRDVPYKTLLLSIRDTAGSVVREMLDKYGLTKADPSQWCLVQVTSQAGGNETEYILDDDECPLAILISSSANSSIMFHVRRRPADLAPRKRKKKPGVIGAQTSNIREPRASDSAPILVELGPDGSTPHPSDNVNTFRLSGEVTEVGSANGITLQLYGPHIQPRHAVISNADDGISITPCHADAYTFVNGQRIHQTTVITHGSLVKFGHSNTYRFLDLAAERQRRPSIVENNSMYDRSPRALSPSEPGRENFETTFDLEGNVETISTASGPREDSRSLGSTSEHRLAMDRYPRGQDPILPAVLEFPEDHQEQFLARVITHLDVTVPTFRLAPAYTLYLCARYRASTHYRPELTPTERAHKLTILLQHAAMLVRHTVQERSTESGAQAFWLANASELLHFLKSDRHVSAFSLQAQDTLADAVQLAFRNLIACLVDELIAVLVNLTSELGDEQPRDIIGVLSVAMNLLRRCRVNAALTIQLFSQLFHFIAARTLSIVVSNATLCNRAFGMRLFNRLKNLQGWAESQGLELAAECHLAKIVQCAHLLQAPKSNADELANLSANCFKLNSLQLRALLTQYTADVGEVVASAQLIEQTVRAAEGVADELAQAEGREVRLHEDPTPAMQLLLPDDGFSCDVVQGVPAGLAEFLQPLQVSGLCRLAAQPTSSGHWTVYMNTPRPPSALSTTQPEVQVIRLHKSGGGMGLSIVAAKGAGQERLGIYIKSVVPGGAADRDGRLAAGDQLLSVDGQSLLGITQEKAAEFLVRTGSVVTLEVAKGGAVYHGLATLLQQPSPTPHRACDSPKSFKYAYRGSQESLYSSHNRHFTPPIRRPKKNVFFNSDDSLYKSEMRKLTIPQINVTEHQPEFKLEVTDFSEPTPKSVTFKTDSDEDVDADDTVEKRAHATSPIIPIIKLDQVDAVIRARKQQRDSQFFQNKSTSLDVPDLPFIDGDNDCGDNGDKYLHVATKLNQCKWSNSLQELSSSTSSLNSTHESQFDLTRIDPNTPVRRWKSPNRVRSDQNAHVNVRSLAARFEQIVLEQERNNSEPNLYDAEEEAVVPRRRDLKSQSMERLHGQLTEFERTEVLKVLHDWGENGSEARSDATFTLKLLDEFRHVERRACYVKFKSEPSLADACALRRPAAKFPSETNVASATPTTEDHFLHECSFKNCIFNKHAYYNRPVEPMIRGILKENASDSGAKQSFFDQTKRRFSDLAMSNKQLDAEMVRGGSWERAHSIGPIEREAATRKFPESYVVTRRNGDKVRQRHNGGANARRNCVPKTWRSCSDIKARARTIKKCCRLARQTCPLLGQSDVPSKRHAQSLDDVDPALDYTAKLAVLKEQLSDFDRPRRMSERDLPSRVDAERTIPSSKSVPALHHITSTASGATTTTTIEQMAARGGPHDIFNPGYSRTSSNNSINTSGAVPQNGGTPTTSYPMHTVPQHAHAHPHSGPPAHAPPPTTPSHNLRSRSAHNLHHQQDTGFYQNLSVYRNKMPSPQELIDRTSALRSSQNSLHSSLANSAQQQQPRPVSAYYQQQQPPLIQQATAASRHQSHSIPNLKHVPSYQSAPYGHHHQQQQQQQQAQQQHYAPPLAQHNFPPTYSPSGVNYQPRPSAIKSQEDLTMKPITYRAATDDTMMCKPPMDPRYAHALIKDDLLLAQQPHHMAGGKQELGEMRHSKSDDILKTTSQNEIMRYASSGSVRAQESTVRQNEMLHRGGEEKRDVRGQAKLAEMSEEVRRRQVRTQQNLYHSQQQPQQQLQQQQLQQQQLHQQQQLQQQQQQYGQQQQPPFYNQSGPVYSNYLNQMVQNTHNFQQLNLAQSGPAYSAKMPPLAPKPPPPTATATSRRVDEPPDLPPTTTHPLYAASMHDPPKMAFYTSGGGVATSKGPARDPWMREEQERKAEVRREQARAWEEQQIRELGAMPYRTPQQEELMRVLQLEREFQRRALEEQEQDDEDTEEKESPSSTPYPLQHAPQPSQVTSSPAAPPPQTAPLTPHGSAHALPPPATIPMPPERGSSLMIMSLHNKEGAKRVTFNDASSSSPVNVQVAVEEAAPKAMQREDPNSFIRQAESMLASPTTPTDGGGFGMMNATPGVIGAQEVYRDPRTRRLAEQAQQQRSAVPVPEKLSFKEKMKMFAMETGESGTPKDKSKISRAQREIDSIGSPAAAPPPPSNLVH